MRVPKDGRSLQGTRVESPAGTVLYTFDGKGPAPSFLPSPGHLPEVFLVADSARIGPPPWGATPPPKQTDDEAHSRCDVRHDPADIYVFIPGKGGYEQLRRDFLKLT